ncbi:MAG: Hsp20/alpha crystallin family protein [Chloroflexi bacterium]|nr:Hsp20/alpha crystallin family protein [Chloroflexota bacterium]
MANTIVRWNPFKEMANMQNAMDRLFEDAWRGNWSAFNGGFTGFSGFDSPALDIHETDTAYNVAVPLPGINPDDINVRMQNGTLTISGELPQPKVEENTKVVVQERYYGKFSRSVSLPEHVDAEKVEATYENGVLTLSLPKLPEAQPKQIAIKINNKQLDSGS